MKPESGIKQFFVATALIIILDAAQSSDNVLYAPDITRKSPAIFVSGEGLDRVDAVTLTTKWHVLGKTQTFNPVIHDNLAIVGSSSGLFAIEVSTGVIRWSLESERPIYTPVISNKTAYAGTQSGHVMAVDIDSGNIEWKVKLDGWIYPPAVTGKHIVAGGSDHRIVGLNRLTGDIEWKLEIGQELVYRPVRVGHELVAITTFANRTMLIRSDTGEPVWSYIDNAPGFSPHVINGRLVSGMLDGRVRSLDLTNGRLIWEIDSGGRPQVSVYPSINTLVVSNGEGEVTALDAGTGSTLWKRIFIYQVKGVFQSVDKRINVVLNDNFNNTWSINVIEPGNRNHSGGQHEM